MNLQLQKVINWLSACMLKNDCSHCDEYIHFIWMEIIAIVVASTRYVTTRNCVHAMMVIRQRSGKE